LKEFEVRPITIRDADAYVAQYHRHNGKARGALLAVAAWTRLEPRMVGVGILGRPVARMLQDGRTCEARGVCTDGTRNANSFLYGALWRAARATGYRRCVSYTLASESGASLRAAGFRPVGSVKGKAWSRPSRPRRDQGVYYEPKIRWEATA